MNKKNTIVAKKIINCLYSHFKNAPKKLKIICDWDEVIQPHEPYALWLAIEKGKENSQEFLQYFKDFWEAEQSFVEYSPYGSRLNANNSTLEKQIKIKNSPEFYQQAPFLTIAKELLKLIKEDKVEKLIFLSAYDKRQFPEGDDRKYKIFSETFGKFSNCSLNLVGFDSAGRGQSKSEWISKNMPNCDVVIDDNPNILAEIVKKNNKITAIAPFYPSIKHHEKILLVENSISNLKKEDFK